MGISSRLNWVQRNIFGEDRSAESPDRMWTAFQDRVRPGHRYTGHHEPFRDVPSMIERQDNFKLYVVGTTRQRPANIASTRQPQRHSMGMGHSEPSLRDRGQHGIEDAASLAWIRLKAVVVAYRIVERTMYSVSP